MYCYKVKASIKDDCINAAYYKEKLQQAISRTPLVPLGNNEYGTDDFAVGISFVCFLGRSNWFVDSAKELLWYNGENYDSSGSYDIENSLAYYLNKRVKNFE